MERYQLLDAWLGVTLKDNPEVLRTKNAHTFYYNLYTIWVSDVQKALKSSLSELGGDHKNPFGQEGK